MITFTTETRIDTRDRVSLAHSLIRFQILLEGITKAQQFPYPVFVTLGNDGPLGKKMRREIERRGGIVIEEPRPGGMMAARFAAIREAIAAHEGVCGRNDAVFCRVEDAKLEQFVAPENWNRVRRAAEAIQEGTVQLVTFHRGEMHGYPDLQRQTEQTASREIARITGLTEYDSHSGPLMMSWEATEQLSQYDGSFGTLWQSTCVLPPVRALAEGFRVGIMPLPDFCYPLAQALIEDGEPTMEAKRRVQAEIPEDITCYIEWAKAQGKWPPKHNFIMLG